MRLTTTRRAGLIVGLLAALLLAVPGTALAIEFTVAPLGGSIVEGSEVPAGTVADVTITVQTGGVPSRAQCVQFVQGHTASIDWDDGTVEPGAITNQRAGGAGQCKFFVVATAHRYVLARPAPYTVRVTVASPAESVTRQRGLQVTEAEYGGEVLPLATITAGETVSGQIASIRDGNDFSTPDRFAATIDWGDGSAPTPGLIGVEREGRFSVAGAHTYAAPGVYTVQVVAFHGGTTALLEPGSVTVVAPGGLTASAPAPAPGPSVGLPPVLPNPEAPTFRLVDRRRTVSGLRSRGVRLRIGLGAFAGTVAQLDVRGTRRGAVRTLATVRLDLTRARIVDANRRIVEVRWRPSARLLRRLALRAGTNYGLRVRFPGSGTLQAQLTLRR